MSEYDREIVESIRKAAGTDLKDDIHIVQAGVTNVNTTSGYTCDCTPLSGGSTTPFKGVLLSACNNDSFILVPAIGSTVLVAVSTKNNPPFVIGCDTLQGIICVVQNADKSLSKLLINYQGNNTIQLNDGSLGGVPVNADILSNLNAILTYVNAIASAISTAGSGNAIPAAVAAIAPSTAPTMSDMQNTKLTHGV